MGISIGYSTPAPQPQQEKVRNLINLLDYLGKDYPNAVKDGKVISKSEYSEMNEFSTQIQNLYQELDKKLKQDKFSNIKDEVAELQSAITQKSSAEHVARLAGNIRFKVLALHLVPVTPQHWPDVAHGAQVFKTHCRSCHGAEGRGNGPLAASLDPTPTNFRDSNNVRKLSPLQAYNTVRLGIAGTGMKAFRELSDKEAWDVAFYVNSLNYRSGVPDSTRSAITKILADTASIENISLRTNQQWRRFFIDHDIEPANGMAVLRTMKKNPAAQEMMPLQKALALLRKAEEAYRSGNYDSAHSFALSAYLQGVEPEENQIRASSPGLARKVENNMMDVRAAIKKRIHPDQVKTRIETASLSIKKAQKVLDTQDYSFWFTFIISASILLREGLEAFLIIMVILGVLRSVNADRATKYVHVGWVVALIIGVISWFFTERLIQMSSLQRELMEGLGALIAVAMLLYIGFWLHNKTHASQWTHFVQNKIHRLLDSNNLWGLAMLSFVVVFREAFESVIFLSSISIKSPGTGNSGIILGSLTAIAAVFLLAFIFLRFSKKLPIRSLFKYSALVMAVLATILVGKGIHNFQEAGYLNIENFPIHLDIPLLGFYPTWQTFLAQVVIVGIIVGLWQYSNRLALSGN